MWLKKSLQWEIKDILQKKWQIESKLELHQGTVLKDYQQYKLAFD